MTCFNMGNLLIMKWQIDSGVLVGHWIIEKKERG